MLNMEKYETENLQDRIRKNIRNLLDSENLTTTQVAERMNIEPSSLSRAMTGGRGFGVEMLIKLGNALNRPMDYFITGRCEQFSPEAFEIPVYDVSASAGYGIEPLKDEDIIEMRLLSRSFLPRKNGEYHIIFVDGDSMTPTLKPNEPVLIDASIKNIASSGIYVLRINDGIFIKRLDRRPDGTVVVISDNKAYGDFVINDGTVLNIIGKAVLNFQIL